MYEESVENEFDLSYPNQRFYAPRFILDRSLYKPGQKIQVVDFVNTGLYKQGDQVTLHN